MPIYILSRKIDFLRKLQSIKNNFSPLGMNSYGQYYPNNYGTYGSYYDSYSNGYNSLNPYNSLNSYSNSHPDYQNVIQNRISKRDALDTKNKNYDLLTNMND